MIRTPRRSGIDGSEQGDRTPKFKSPDPFFDRHPPLARPPGRAPPDPRRPPPHQVFPGVGRRRSFFSGVSYSGNELRPVFLLSVACPVPGRSTLQRARTGAGLEPSDFFLELIDSFLEGAQSQFSSILAGS